MKTMYLLVLAVVGLTFSSAFAEEVLVNRKTGEVRVEVSNPWSPVNAFEDEAFRNPGTEIPVSPVFTGVKKIDFFHSVFVKTATNVVVYKDGKISYMAKDVRDNDDVIFFLWYKILFIVGVVFAIVGVKLKDTDTVFRFAIATAIATAIAAVVAAAIATAIATAIAAVVAVVVAAIAVVVAAIAAADDQQPTTAKIFLAVYIISAMVAIVV